MALETAAKTTMLNALDTVAVTAVILDGTPAVLDIQAITFTVSGGSMSLGANVVFDIAAGKIVTMLAVYKVDGTTLLFSADLSGTEAERTYTYAGTYTLTACTVTLS
jgi:hypothetical protein